MGAPSNNMVLNTALKKFINIITIIIAHFAQRV